MYANDERGWWLRFVAAVVVALAAIGLVVALTGCGQSVTGDAPLAEPPSSAATLPVPSADEIELTDAERAALLLEVQAIADALPPSDGLIYLDGIEAETRSKFDAKEPTGEVEKGSYPSLLGWGVKPCLAFQDGTPADCGQDHCSLFNLSCDDEWHAQAKSVYYGNYSEFVSELTGMCAPNDGSGNAWNPCILPALEPGNRVLTWNLDQSACGGSSVLKRLQREALVRILTYLGNNADLEFYEDPVRSSTTALGFRCGGDVEVGSDVAGHWSALGDLELKYALATTDGFSIIANENCETPGYPGFNSPASYSQALDMAYIYRRGEVVINMSQLVGKLNECITSENDIRHGFEFIWLHELGHHFGFHHDNYAHADFGVMYGGGIACEEMVDTSPGFGPFRLQAMLDLDVSTYSDALTVYDDELSCLVPF